MSTVVAKFSQVPRKPPPEASIRGNKLRRRQSKAAWYMLTLLTCVSSFSHSSLGSHIDDSLFCSVGSPGYMS